MLFERRNVSLTSPPKWLLQYLEGGEGSYSGEAVSVEGSLKVSAVLAAFTVVSEDISSLPLILYRRLQRGKERATDNAYYGLMHDAPNPEHTSMIFREIMMGHLLGWGNFYGQLLWDARGVVREIWPLKPNQMQVFRGTDGARKYLYRPTTGGQIAFRQEDILHIPAFGFDGLIGYSRIALARNAIGLSMAAEKYGSKTFANGARPSIVLLSKKQMNTDVQERLRESWNQTYGGSGNAGKTAVLEDDMNLKEIGFPPEDAQFLQTRQFQVEEIARIFRVPPHMIGNLEKSTSWGTGIEQQEMGYLSHTLRPWMSRIEQQLNKDLLLGADRQVYFFEHLADALLRTDLQARMTAYSTALINGVMNANEVREKENMNPYDGGDVYRVQLNTAPAGAAPTTTPAGSAGMRPAAQRDDIPEALLRDAVDRITRREIHDLGDAIKRWAEKKPEKYMQWMEQFYKRDHPEFISQIMEPFVKARYLTAEEVSRAASIYCERRGTALFNDDADWDVPAKISAELFGIIEEIATSGVRPPRNDMEEGEHASN